jgi:hypothetical protein
LVIQIFRVVLLVLDISTLILILLIFNFCSWLFYKKIICFQFHPSMSICYVLFFPIWSLLFWFLIFFLDLFMLFLFVFNFILQSKFMIYIYIYIHFFNMVLILFMSNSFSLPFHKKYYLCLISSFNPNLWFITFSNLILTLFFCYLLTLFFFTLQ